MATVADRFWEKVEVRGPDECWEWRSTKNQQGYGRFSVTVSQTAPRQKWHSAHRLSWEWTTGQQPGEMLVCHRCDNPACVNPAHLFLGTDLDNARDRDAKGRLGPRKGEANGRAKLRLAEVTSIRAEHAAGRSQTELALKYGVSRGNINGIVAGKYWAHVA